MTEALEGLEQLPEAELERLRRRPTEVPIVMISRGDLAENQRKAAALRLGFPIVLQRHWEISRAYGIFATPVAYLIDRAGLLACDVAVGGDAILRLIDGFETSMNEDRPMEVAS